MPRVLVIRRDDRFSELLREAGFEVENLELVRTRAVDDLSDLFRTLKRLEDYDGLFFTSPAAAEVFVKHVRPNSVSGKIYVLGQRARRILAENGFEVVFRSDANTADELLGSFDGTEFKGKRIMFVRGDRSLRTIPESLSAIAEVDEVVVYETVAAQPDSRRALTLKKEIRSGQIGWVSFFSPSGVDEFNAVFDSGDFNGLKVAAIGATTAKRASGLGMNVEFISERSSAEDFARGLIEHIRAN